MKVGQGHSLETSQKTLLDELTKNKEADNGSCPLVGQGIHLLADNHGERSGGLAKLLTNG